MSCQKTDGRGHARPSYFWYDNDKDIKVCFLVTRIISVPYLAEPQASCSCHWSDDMSGTQQILGWWQSEDIGSVLLQLHPSYVTNILLKYNYKYYISIALSQWFNKHLQWKLRLYLLKGSCRGIHTRAHARLSAVNSFWKCFRILKSIKILTTFRH